MLLFLTGFFELSFNSMAQTIVQLRAPDAIRGRVIGLYATSSLGLRCFAGFSVGLLGASIGIHRSLALSALFVLLVVGWSRHAAATLLATLVGLFGMIAGCWAFGVKVNFLDFVALPLVLGIGVDYAANVALRDREEGDDDSETLRSLTGTGGAVVLCSYTTIIGYGSLILSDNAGIRSFGMAATLGEVACLVSALTVVPVVLHYWRRRPVLQAARS